MEKLARTKLTTKDGVKGFDLFLEGASAPGKSYGFYPLENQFDVISQINMAVQDAKDYGYTGIKFEDNPDF